jgi:hypothetical protein
MAKLDEILTKFVGGEAGNVLGAAFIVLDNDGQSTTRSLKA